MSTSDPCNERLDAVIRRKALLCAFDHCLGTKCDSRIAAYFLRAGMLKSGITLPDVPKNIVEAFRDPQHHSRMPLDHGPLVLVKVPDSETEAQLVSAFDLLCASRQEARDAALMHLERIPALTPISRQVLAEYAEDIRSADIDRWLTAAMRTERVLTSDFNLNLAGFHIAGDLNDQQLQQHYWVHVTQGCLDSLLSMNSDGYRLVKPSGQRQRAIEALVEGKDSAFQALCAYDNSLGHLPLHAECDIGTAMKLWRHGRPVPNLLDVLREWCNSSAHPVRVVQAAIVGVANQDELTPAGRVWLRDTLVGLVSPCDGSSPETLGKSILELEADVARYYFRVIEMRVPGLDVDRIATLSWWAARKIADVIATQVARTKDPIDCVLSIHKSAIQPMAQQSEFEWHASHPRSGSSSIRYGTLFCLQPRILGLLIRLSGAAEMLGQDIGRDKADRIAQAFVRHHIRCFPIETSTLDNAVWAFDASLGPAFLEWAESMCDGPDRERLVRLAEAAAAAADTGQLVAEMKSLSRAPDITRMFFAHLFQVGAYCRSDAAGPLWQLAMDVEWRKETFEQLSVECLQPLFDGIMELARRVDDDRVLELPHIFAEQYEKHEADSERRSLLFAMTVLASAAVGRVSAIRRIVTRTGRDRESISYWREQIRDMLPVSPPTLQGRLRDVLSSLAVH